MSSEVCHCLNMSKKDLCSKDKTFMNTLNEKRQELVRVNLWFREDYLKWKWTRESSEMRNSDVALYETNQQLEFTEIGALSGKSMC